MAESENEIVKITSAGTVTFQNSSGNTWTCKKAITSRYHSKMIPL